MNTCPYYCAAARRAYLVVPEIGVLKWFWAADPPPTALRVPLECRRAQRAAQVLSLRLRGSSTGVYGQKGSDNATAVLYRPRSGQARRSHRTDDPPFMRRDSEPRTLRFAKTQGVHAISRRLEFCITPASRRSQPLKPPRAPGPDPGPPPTMFSSQP